MNAKTIMGISFTGVFVLSIISSVTAIQADSLFKIRHLPEFKTKKSDNMENIQTSLPESEKIVTVLDESSFNYRNLNNHFKN